MADYNHQHQAALQHLAHLQQDLVQRQGASVLQPQVALAEIQALERERLGQSVQHQVGEQLQSQQPPQ